MGYLRDIRRMTVALSRARLGLYILGRREVFEAVYELRPAFEQLFARPDKLTLVTGEMWPSKRVVAEEEGPVEGEVVMEGVEHLGQYVFEMTRTRMEGMVIEGGAGEGVVEEVVEEVVDEGEGEAAVLRDEDADEDEDEGDGEVLGNEAGGEEA